MRRIVATLAAVCGAGVALAAGAPSVGAPSVDAPLKTGLSAPGDVAVVIGNEDYGKIADVPYARADAAAFESFLVYTRGVTLDRVRTLRDASKEDMLKAVEEMAAKRPTGVFWIYYAGHGMADPQTGNRVLLGWDAKGGAAELVARGQAVVDLQRAAAKGGGQVVMVVDACYNGETRAGESLTGGARIAVPEGMVTLADVVEWTASAPSQLAMPLASVGHGAFTYLAIGAMRGWADGQKDGKADGVVTLEEAQLYVQQQLSVMQITGQQPLAVGPSVALSGKAGARLERGPSPEVVRGLASAGVSGGSGGVGSSVTVSPGSGGSGGGKAWTAADDAALQALAEAERARRVEPIRAEQATEALALAAVRQRAVAAEWADLRAALGEPERAQAAAVAAVQQKVAQWRAETVSAATRKITLIGEVSWGGRSLPMNEVIEVKGAPVPVDHGATIREAEAWIAASSRPTVAASQPIASLGRGPIIMGALERSAIDAVIQTRMADIELCYQRLIGKKLGVTGEVTIYFIIAKDGSVFSSQPQASNLRSVLVDNCVNDIIRQLTFPKPKNDAIVIVSYPFTFSPG